MDEKNGALALYLGGTAAAGAPLAGPFWIIFLCALTGAAWQLSLKDRMQPWQGIRFIFRGTSAACIFTSLVSWGIEKHWQVPAVQLAGPVAFVIALYVELFYTKVLPNLWPLLLRWASRRG